eukprot:CAMPEP_0177196156 /NCGR_PEP_ID=MMETSP0367-20130122/23895_1 /TAXON_ID=447022 ORGANISM="Scrippsiella hangoei-like, Strain SHHI-4" /NCGR_SAMPLE_ID=MMETSP0367 /ASSEMBLY_ACC=CAM_ASM_000362 /LENGTH=364 /DNA_ID=CAMNT_0018644229 /DNA_START=107 /DNA_END=1198 /DNA_ORIENTATION=-
MTRLDGEKEKIKLKLTKQTTVAAIRQRIEMELGIAAHEQLLLFRGKILTKDSLQPLSTPDLQDIIAESGEDGLQMAVAYRPKRLPGFLKREGLEDVNEKRATGATPLHRATRQSELGVMEELLEMEEFMGSNARDRSGQSALHTAVCCRNREAVGVLMASERFAAASVLDLDGQSALHIAAHWGDRLSIDLILKNRFFNAEALWAVDRLGYTALVYATDCGNTEAAELIANKQQKVPKPEFIPPPEAVPTGEPDEGQEGADAPEPLDGAAGREPGTMPAGAQPPVIEADVASALEAPLEAGAADPVQGQAAASAAPAEPAASAGASGEQNGPGDSEVQASTADAGLNSDDDIESHAFKVVRPKK